MKLTKNKLAQLIREELRKSNTVIEQMGTAEPASDVAAPAAPLGGGNAQFQTQMLETMKGIMAALEKLDTSIDFLAAAATGESAIGVEASQRAMGRFARPEEKAAAAPEKEQSFGAELRGGGGTRPEDMAQMAANRAAEAYISRTAARERAKTAKEK